jgi:hypothetical protein
MGEFKNIEYHADCVVITHYTMEEYEDKLDPLYSYDDFKKEILKCYTYAESLSMCKIIKICKSTIKIQMKRYTMLLSPDGVCQTTTPDALCVLFHFMYNNKIFQYDFAPRNIGIDEVGNLHIIDLDTTGIISNLDKPQFLKLLKEFDFEFIHAGFGEVYNKAITLFHKAFV